MRLSFFKNSLSLWLSVTQLYLFPHFCFSVCYSCISSWGADVCLAVWRVNLKADLPLQLSRVCMCSNICDLTLSHRVCVHWMCACIFDVLALREDGWVSLSSTAAGKTSVAPNPQWADRRDFCMTSHWCLHDLRGHSLLPLPVSRLVSACAYVGKNKWVWKRVIADCECVSKFICPHLNLWLKLQFQRWKMDEWPSVSPRITFCVWW